MSKIKLQNDMRMKCALYGEGIITSLERGDDRSIVLNINERYHRYFNDGRLENGTLPTLKLLNIPFTEGMDVECDIYGKGVVIQIVKHGLYQVEVEFENGDIHSYLPDGRFTENANITLYPQFIVKSNE